MNNIDRIDTLADRYITQQWENLGTTLGVIEAGGQCDRLARAIAQVFTTDEMEQLRAALATEIQIEPERITRNR